MFYFMSSHFSGQLLLVRRLQSQCSDNITVVDITRCVYTYDNLWIVGLFKRRTTLKQIIVDNSCFVTEYMSDVDHS